MKGIKSVTAKRIVSISLAAAMLMSGLNGYMYTGTVKNVKAASVESGMETNELLSSKYIADPEVLRLYIILANAVKKKDAAAIKDLSEKTAKEILESGTYNTADYTGNVEGQFLIEYGGKIDFTGMKIGDISGIGWARGATEINLAGAVFDKAVTEVPADEFAACTKLEKIILPDTVTKIGNRAFQNDLSLKTLQTGNGLNGVIDLTGINEVGDSAFSGCAAIEKVDFAEYGSAPELKLGAYAFSACVKISEIKIPIKTTENIGTNVFENCSALKEVGLLNELTYLNNGLFKGTGTYTTEGVHFYIIGKEEEEVSRLPENIEYIGSNCFEGAYLKKMDLSRLNRLYVLNQYSFAGAIFMNTDTDDMLILPDNLKRIESLAFTGSGILSLKVPEQCTYIGNKAFANSAIVQISFPKGLKEIKEETFKGCELLAGELIMLPKDSELTSIGAGAFNGCKNLNTTAFLKNLKKLTDIGESAFADCYGIEKIGNSEQSDMYKNKRLACGLREVILPDCVKTLGEGVFSNDYAMQTADLGLGIIHIPDRAFANSMSVSQSPAKLEKVIVSSELDSIGDEAFLNQARLHTIGYKKGTGVEIKEGTAQFNEGLLSIGDRAFEGCGVESRISVSGGIAYVPKTGVKTSYEKGLSKFMVYDYEGALSDVNNCRIVYINEASIVSTSDMEDEGDYNRLLGELTESGKEKYDKLYLAAKEVYVNEAVMHDISESAPGEPSLETYGVYDTVTDEYAERLYNLTDVMPKIYCPNTAEAKESAITVEPSGDNVPVWINIKSSSQIKGAEVKNITSQSFNIYYTFGLKNIIIPDTVINDRIGKGAFKNCINLNEVKLSDNLSEIKDDTFSGCGYEIKNSTGTSEELRYYDYGGLRTVTIPNSIKKIGNNAFRSNYNLKLERFWGSSFGTAVESIGDNAFYECYSLDEIYFPTSLKSIGREAFAKCTLQEERATEIPYHNSSQKYSFYKNKESYGTKEIKRGLRIIDFTAATSLESVGTGAFKITNVETINLTKSPLTVIPDNLFEQCTYLKTVTFQNDTKSVGANVLKDNINLITVMIPAGATLKKNTVSGAFGSFVGRTEPTVNLSQKDEDSAQVIPINGTRRLPVNAINENTINGEVKITVNTGTEENPNWQNIIDRTVLGVSAYIEKETDGRYSFILEGKDYMSEPVTVRLEAGTKFQHASAPDDFLPSTHTMLYRVTVDDITSDSVMVTASEDKYVSNNPAMYEESSQGKVLHIAQGKKMSEDGIVLTAYINPKETTDDIIWESSDGVIGISDEKYETGTGTATARITASDIGYADITVKAVSKKTGIVSASDKIRVYSEIPVASGGLTAETAGTYLGTSLKTNSRSNPYPLSVGDSDRIIIKTDYGDTDYTDGQIAAYGEKYVFASSDENVMTVSVDGTFKAVGEGIAKITVTAQASGEALEFWFAVTDNNNYKPVLINAGGDKVSLNDKNQLCAVMDIGETIKLSADVIPKRASQEVIWNVTSGADIVSVDENGTVTGLKKGNARVAAVSKEADTVKSQEIFIEVKSPARELKLLCGNCSMQTGSTMTISKTTDENDNKGYYISPVDSTDTITWLSSNEQVLSVVSSNTQSVTVKAVSAGTATLTASASSGISASIQVTVSDKPVKVTGIKTETQVTLNVGDTHKLNPQKLPENSTESVTYTYQSADSKIAVVDADGVISALSPGTTYITVRTNTGKSARCRVEVKLPAKKLTLLVNKPGKKKLYMAKGESIQINVKVNPENSTDSFTYKSSRQKVVTVTQGGYVTAKNKGKSKVTVTASSGKKAAFTIIVSKKPLRSGKVRLKAPKKIKRGRTVRITPTLIKKKSTDTVSFSSSKPQVAEVDKYGYVTALKKGKVKITVTASSGKKAVKKIKIK